MNFYKLPVFSFESAAEQLDLVKILYLFYKEAGLGDLYIDTPITSPLRKDNKAGCRWVISNNDGCPIFIDNSRQPKFRNIFSFIADYSNISTKEALDVVIKLAENTDIKIRKSNNNKGFSKKKLYPTQLGYRKCEFTEEGLSFWLDYGITKEQLIEDKVFQIDRLVNKKYKNGKYELYNVNLYNKYCFLYTDFEKGVKAYLPKQPNVPKSQFYTNIKFEVGNSHSLYFPSADQLYITKSYKDWRVLKNAHKYFDIQTDGIWFQSENTLPENSVLELISKYKNVVYFGDNDKPGIKACEHIRNKFLSLNIEIETAVPYKYNDFAELQKECGIEDFYDYII